MMQPMGNNLIVIPMKMEKTTKAGFIIPDDQKRRHDNASLAAKISAVGPLAFQEEKEGGARIPDVGDYILIKKYAGVDANLGGKNVVKIIWDEDVLALTDKETVENMTQWS